MKHLFLIISLSMMLGAQEENNDNDVFTFSASTRYSTAQIIHGVDVSRNQGTISNGITIGHANGLSFSYFNTSLSARTTLNNTFSVGYSYDFTDFFSGDIDFTHISYPDQSINAVAEFPNVLAVSVSADLQLFDLSLSYDKHFGTGAPSYIGIDAMKILLVNDWAFIPLIDMTFISQEINFTTAKFKPNSANSKKTGQLVQSVVSLSGISGVTFGCAVRYDLGKGFSTRFVPQMSLTPKQEIAAHSTQWTASLGVSYTTGF
ncbi:MAG: TorF family putative porin [Bacteroidota bacterium]